MRGNKMKKTLYYLTIAAATIGAPIISEMSGCSKNFAEESIRQNERIRERYPEEHREYYKKFAEISARIMADSIALGLGLFLSSDILKNSYRKSER